MYVDDRQQSREQKIGKRSTGIPITVRQLEAIIRLSEAIAKIHLSTVVRPAHVDEAHRIFKVSTLHAVQSGMTSSIETPAEMMGIVGKVEEAIKRRVAIGTKISYQKLHDELALKFDNLRAIDHAILSMVRKEEF